MATDLTQILGSVTSSGGVGGGFANGYKAAAADTQGAIIAGAQAQAKVQLGQAAIENQKLQGQLEAQQNSRQTFNDLGGNEITSFLATRMRESAIAASEAARRQTELESNNSLFTNPAGFLRDLIQGDEIRNTAAATSQEFQTNAGLLQGVNQAAQQSTATQNAVAETMTQATLGQAAQIQQGNLELIAADARSKLANVDMQLVSSLDSLNSRQISQANAARQLSLAEERQQWARAEQQEKKTADADLLNNYNTGAKLLGQPTVGSISGLRTQISLNGDRVEYTMRRGAELISGAPVRLGSNPLEALVAADRYSVNLPPTQRDMAKKLTGSLSTMSADSLVASGLAKNMVEANQLMADKTKRASLQASWMDKQVQAMATTVRPGDATNIYALPQLDVLKDKKYMSENPFLAKFVAPIASAGKAEFDPSRFVGLGAEAVAKGEATTAQVSDGLTWMANQLALTNNALNGYKAFGLPEMSRVVMPYSVGTGRIFGDLNGNIDMTDAVAVNRLMTQIITSTPKATLSERFTDLLQRNSELPISNTPAVPGAARENLNRMIPR